MRTIKDPLERKNEILDTAEALFFTKGYEKTTINDILNEIGIAKGTFYYYFKSKDEVMDAIVVRMASNAIQAAEAVADNPNLPVQEKLIQIFANSFSSEHKEEMIEHMHQSGNAELHQRSLTQCVVQLTPVLTRVLEQGISEGLFSTPYPKECIESLLVSTQFLFDEGLFQWAPEELQRKIAAQIYMMERILGAAPGSLAYVAGFFSTN